MLSKRSASFRTGKLITFVKDRPGHDRRYAIDARKIERELGWKPRENFESGIRKTVQWYLQNEEWVKDVTSGSLPEVDRHAVLLKPLGRSQSDSTEKICFMRITIFGATGLAG